MEGRTCLFGCDLDRGYWLGKRDNMGACGPERVAPWGMRAMERKSSQEFTPASPPSTCYGSMGPMRPRRIAPGSFPWGLSMFVYSGKKSCSCQLPGRGPFSPLLSEAGTGGTLCVEPLWILRAPPTQEVPTRTQDGALAVGELAAPGTAQPSTSRGAAWGAGAGRGRPAPRSPRSWRLEPQGSPSPGRPALCPPLPGQSHHPSREVQQESMNQLVLVR